MEGREKGTKNSPRYLAADETVIMQRQEHILKFTNFW